MPTQDAIDDALELLAWYQVAGVDAVVTDVPIDWLARGSVPPAHGFAWPSPDAGPEDARAAEMGLSGQPPQHATPAATQAVRIGVGDAPAKPRPQTPLAAREAETEARRIADAADTIAALEAALRNFNGCSLKATATNLCFYRGAPDARLMFIGEAPGRDEDIAGKPFVGRAGQMLDKMLAAIGLTEADVHITNVVYWRPPGNRTPTTQEALACRPFLERQIELVNPDIVVALGGSAAKEVFGIAEGIMRLRGKWRSLDVAGRQVAAIATLHPAYLLRTPAAKQLAWLDLLQIKSWLQLR